jgi:hypothetical protein
MFRYVPQRTSKQERRSEMSSGMTVQDLLVSFLRFADLPDSQRETYLRQHSEILNANVVGTVLMQARMREPEFQRRVGGAAFYIATKLNNKELQAEARKFL